MDKLKKINIAILIPDFDNGGEEKRVVYFANNYTSVFKNVYLFAPLGKSKIKLNPNVTHIVTNNRNLLSLFKIAYYTIKLNIDVFQGHKRFSMVHLFVLEFFFRRYCLFNFDNIYITGNSILRYITPKNIVYLSDVLLNFYAKYYSNKKYNQKVIQMGGDFYNVIPKEEIDIFKFNLKIQNKVVLMSIGRLDEQKNQKMLIETLSLGVDFNYVLLIVGDGPLKGFLNDLVNKLNLNNKVVFIEHTENVELLYNVCDVLVQSSIFEGFPNVLIEAASLSIPIVASNVGSSSSIVKENGLLFNPEDKNQLRICLNEVVKNYDDFKIRSLQFSKSEIFSKFNKEEMLKNYIRHYEFNL